MPPKKATAAKAKATPAKSPAATAASGRPRRATAKDAPTPTPAKKAPAKKATTKAATASTTPATKKRGRPAKTEHPDTEAELESEPPRKRGRPAKAKIETPQTDATADPPKKRGRPTKSAAATKDAPAVPPETETAPPKRRGRPPKGGETTKIAGDDPAAAEQLEDELVDAAEAEDEPSSKRAPPAKKGKAGAKGRGRKAKPVAGEAQNDAADEADGAADSAVEAEEGAEDNDATGTSFWLMKAEQIDREEKLQDGSVFNTKFTIDDLRAKAGPEPWDGVRNPTACKNMREMKVGDLAFFYASGAKGKALQPGITGIMEVVQEHEPDMSAFDEKHPYYVQNAKQRGTKEKPRWSMVHVEFRKKLREPVGLKELQQFSRDSGVLANMQEFNAARLSVSKVSPKEWNFIVDNLIEGYDDEAAVDGDKRDNALPTTTTEYAAVVVAPIITGGAAKDQAIPTSETAAASVEVNGTSRAGSLKPSSRAPSRAASRASSKPPSRSASQGNLAPPRAQSRGRSRSPASRAGSVKPKQGVPDQMETVEE